MNKQSYQIPEFFANVLITLNYVIKILMNNRNCYFYLHKTHLYSLSNGEEAAAKMCEN